MLISAYVVLFLVEYLWGTGCTRLLNIMDGRQHLVFHLDELYSLLRNLQRFRRNRRHGIAHVFGRIAGLDHEEAILQIQADALDIVRAVNDAFYAGELFRLRQVNRQHLCVGMGAALDRRIQHARQADIVHIFGGAGHFADTVAAFIRFSNMLEFFH